MQRSHGFLLLLFLILVSGLAAPALSTSARAPATPQSLAGQFRNFSGAPLVNTWYPVAIANKIAGTDLDPGGHDINANFNSSFPDWYFGTDGNPPFNQ